MCFYDRLISLSMVFPRFIHVVACRYVILFYDGIILFHRMDGPQYVYFFHQLCDLGCKTLTFYRHNPVVSDGPTFWDLLFPHGASSGR